MENNVTKFFDIEKINENYRLVIADFDRINKNISCKRDSFDEVISLNMLRACNYVNIRLASESEKEILAPHDMLELNLIILLGIDDNMRMEYRNFIKHTEEIFVKRVPSLIKWYDRHENREDNPYKIAAGIYVRVLSGPQLFFDGNHRTGSLVSNYYLLQKGKAPFVLTPQNAIEFFNLASDVKFKSEDIGSKFKRAIGWRDELARMRAFLEANARPFTTDAMPEWTRELREPPDS